MCGDADANKTKVASLPRALDASNIQIRVLCVCVCPCVFLSVVVFLRTVIAEYRHVLDSEGSYCRRAADASASAPASGLVLGAVRLLLSRHHCRSSVFFSFLSAPLRAGTWKSVPQNPDWRSNKSPRYSSSVHSRSRYPTTMARMLRYFYSKYFGIFRDPYNIHEDITCWTWIHWK